MYMHTWICMLDIPRFQNGSDKKNTIIYNNIYRYKEAKIWYHWPALILDKISASLARIMHIYILSSWLNSSAHVSLQSMKSPWKHTPVLAEELYQSIEVHWF